jgi:hypothetical protein
MAIPRVSPRVTNARGRSDGNRVRNSILLGLPADECDVVFKKLEFVQLPTNFVLQEAGPIKFAYFINSGLASVLDGENVEVDWLVRRVSSGNHLQTDSAPVQGASS